MNRIAYIIAAILLFMLINAYIWWATAKHDLKVYEAN